MMLGLGDPNPSTIRLLMVDQSGKRTIGILHDVLVKVESFIFLDDFVILDYDVDFEGPHYSRKTIPCHRAWISRHGKGADEIYVEQ